jgi:uncharacterized protein
MALLRYCKDEKPEDGLPVWRLNLVQEIITNRIREIPNKNREVPLVWSIMHMYTITQLAKILALKRNLNPELAGLLCVFHDIHTLHTGEHRDHGLKAEPYIKEIIGEYNERWGSELGYVTEDETVQIVDSLAVHSDKLAIVDDPYTELLKDVDSLDAYLHGMEPLESNGRLDRVNSTLEEFGLPRIQ